MSEVVNMLGERQAEMLRLLKASPAGLTVDELARALGITRNAVRQHLTVLETEGLVRPGASRPTRGRPETLFCLTEKGTEAFPRKYAWMAQMVVDWLAEEYGERGLATRLATLGRKVATQLKGQQPPLRSRQEKVERLAGTMAELGYNARALSAAGAPVIEADNCIFHALAVKNPNVCKFDLALMGEFTDSDVEHQECMARGGRMCRFKFVPQR